MPQPGRDAGIGLRRQLGILQGRLGALAAGEVVLGYVSLPPNFGLARELDLYWDDRRIAATFAR